MARVMEAVAGWYPADAPTLGEILESKLRHRVFWPGSQPGRWGRLLSFVNECRRIVPDDVFQPDLGVRPGQAGQAGANGGSGDRSQTAAPDGIQPGRGDASQRQAAGSGATGSGAGGSGHSAQTASGSLSFLATVLAKLLGRE